MKPNTNTAPPHQNLQEIQGNVTCGRPTAEQAELAIATLLSFIGEDSAREGLRDTPRRVCKAWKDDWAAGYGVDTRKLLTKFKDGVQRVPQMITVTGIPVESHCEHHLARFHGHAHVAYLPGEHIVGLSKINRLVEAFSRRLQVQERLTEQIADSLFSGLLCRGVGVVLVCEHSCVCSRGVKHSGCRTRTTALLGDFLNSPETRNEFMQAIPRA